MDLLSRLALLLGVVLLFGCSSTMRAQEIRVVDGQKHIVHTVAKGQTLYAITRHYAVPMQDLLAANPSAAQGLSIGQVLLIPVKAQVKKELKTAPAFMEGELAHKVRKKETLYGIAQKYGVEQADLIARNPQLTAGVKEDMIVVIPVSRVTTASAQLIAPASEDGGTMHLVQQGETIYALSTRYGVAEQELRAANGGLPQGLKAGTYVRIPTKQVEAPVPMDTVRVVPGALHKVALLLPFSIAANDSAHAARPEEKGLYSVTDAAVQFYAGVQMALDSLKRSGFHADVAVLDVGEHAATWTPALRDPSLRDAELCIGPFHRAAIESLSRSVPTAHVVCPVPQSNKVLLGHPNVSKVLSTRPDQVQQMARYIAYQHARDNIIFCAPDIAPEKELREQMLTALQEALLPQPSRLRDSVLVARPNRKDVADIVSKLHPTKLNAVVVPSEDVEFVTAVVRKLAELVPDKRIIVFGLNGWMDMSSLESADLAALQTCIPVSTWIDHADPRVQRFVVAYRDRYQNEPGEYAFLGFDVGYFYLKALMEHGAAFPEHFNEVTTAPLHMGFRLNKAGEEHGYRNETAVVLQYGPLGLRKAP